MAPWTQEVVLQWRSDLTFYERRTQMLRAEELGQRWRMDILMARERLRSRCCHHCRDRTQFVLYPRNRNRRRRSGALRDTAHQLCAEP